MNNPAFLLIILISFFVIIGGLFASDTNYQHNNLVVPTPDTPLLDVSMAEAMAGCEKLEKNMMDEFQNFKLNGQITLLSTSTRRNAHFVTCEVTGRVLINDISKDFQSFGVIEDKDGILVGDELELTDYKKMINLVKSFPTRK